MEFSIFFEYLGKALSAIAACAGAYWAFMKWLQREEHFPRINFDLSVDVLGSKDSKTIINVLCKIENKGHVPLKIRDFFCELRGLNDDDEIELGSEIIRNQLNFKNDLGGGSFIPLDWDSSFVHPGVTTTYTFVTFIPSETSYLFVKGKFIYMGNNEEHHAGTIMKIPDSA